MPFEYGFLPLFALGVLLAAGAVGCDQAAAPQAHADEAAVDAHADEHDHEHPELASFMGDLQRFSQKLGYSIQGQNAPLAGFYIHELEETFEEIGKEVPEYEGHQIATLLEGMGPPALEGVEQALDAEDWSAASRQYEALIASCNACHAATEHAFIQITPAEGEPPFNQRFEPR